MKRDFLILVVLLVSAVGASAWGVTCSSGQTYDYGPCDTVYYGPFPPDTFWTSGSPYLVRVPIYVTFDPGDTLVKNPNQNVDTVTYSTLTDSIYAFVFPFCFTHSNPSKYCSLSGYWNATAGANMFNQTRGIFRHLVVSPTDTIYNWMKLLSEEGNGEEWDGITANLDGTSHFWLSLVPTGTEDRRFGPGSRVLLLTMTFKLEDSMQICIDSCLWPPSSRLQWANSVAGNQTYVPRLWIPRSDTSSYEVCFNIHRGAPYFTMDATPDTQTIPAGDSTNYNVILTSMYGFATPCTLSAKGLPTDASASFALNPATPTDTSVMTIKTALTTPAGYHTIWVIAKAGIKDSTKVVLELPSDVKEIESQDESKPSVFSLSQNYPNPFNPVTNFQFTLPKPVHVRIDIFNIVGQKVSTLVDKDMKPGVFVADWNGKDERGTPVSSGIYFYRMRAGDFTDMKKMVLLK